MFTDFHTKRLSWVDNIFRVRGPFKTRLNKLRLDKNERVSNFERKFFNRIFFIHNILISIFELNNNFASPVNQTFFQFGSVVIDKLPPATLIFKL